MAKDGGTMSNPKALQVCKLGNLFCYCSEGEKEITYSLELSEKRVRLCIWEPTKQPTPETCPNRISKETKDPLNVM